MEVKTALDWWNHKEPPTMTQDEIRTLLERRWRECMAAIEQEAPSDRFRWVVYHVPAEPDDPAE